MRRRFLGLLVLAAASALAVAGVAAADHPGGGGTPFFAQMTGAQECVPAPGGGFLCGNVGDPDGTGTAELRLNQGQGEICFTITVANIATATAAHIHRGGPTVAGPVVVPTMPAAGDAADGTFSGCTTGVDKELIKEIRQNPEQFYVNVHNPAFPRGAVRGGLCGPGRGHCQ